MKKKNSIHNFWSEIKLHGGIALFRVVIKIDDSLSDRKGLKFLYRWLKSTTRFFSLENGCHVLIKDANFEYFDKKTYFQPQFRNVVIDEKKENLKKFSHTQFDKSP